MKWAERGKRAFADRPGYGLFGIVQGSIWLDWRSWVPSFRYPRIAPTQSS
jgi:queuine/archaeosine tRNA-ribosyltransferase